MMLLKSFDNYHLEKQREQEQHLQWLNAQRQDIEQKIEQEKTREYSKALNKASAEILAKKETEVREIACQNSEHLKTIQKIIEDSLTQQSKHYAHLLTGILNHFMPEMTVNHSVNQIMYMLETLLKSCDKREIFITANPETIIFFEKNINMTSRRVAFKEDNTMDYGRIHLDYSDGGGADINIADTQKKVIETIQSMIGQDIQAILPNSNKDVNTDTHNDMDIERQNYRHLNL